MRINKKYVLVVAAFVIVSSAIVGYQTDSVRWRVTVLKIKAGGDLPSLPWGDLLTMLKPGSGIFLRGLIETPNSYAVIRNPFNSAADIENGEEIYSTICMHCHGTADAAGTAPDLFSGSSSNGDSDWALFRTLSDGIDGTAMAPSSLLVEDRWRVIGYILNKRHSDGIVAPVVSDALSRISVSSERILNAQSEPQNWLTYSGTYSGKRHTVLNGINKSTLGELSLKWVLQADNKEKIEASPIVVDGVMFLSLPEGGVVAIDATTGEKYWQRDAKITETLAVCCGRVNRGVAILDDKIFVATLDNKLRALDVVTGQIVWESRIADGADSYTTTVAPLVVKDNVIVGVSGGEYGIRGFLAAYNAESGVEAWRFNTIPGPGEPGNDSWSGESWRTGGGPTWVTGSYDPELDLLYWGVGNPSPDFDGAERIGDNLYSNSVIALDPDTGTLRWHFQFTPHDLHDFDSNQIPVLVDETVDGQERKVILWANRNGFFYSLNRETGQYLGSVPFARQSWASKIDEQGRPVRAKNATPSLKGTLVWPGASGATNWPPPSFSPTSGLFYVLRLDRPSVFFTHETVEDRVAGEFWLGSASTFVPDTSEVSVVAIDPVSLSIVWESRLPNVGGRGRYSGLLTTSQLVFVGEGQTIAALDADTGDRLWSSRLGAEVSSPPVTYSVDGIQYLVIAAGKNIFAFGVKND